MNRFLTVPDPIIIHHSVDPAQVPPEHPSAWDVEIKTEDTMLKTRMSAMVHMSKESAQDLAKLDEEVRLYYGNNKRSRS